MHTGIPRKSSSFKLVLNKSSTPGASRLPTSRLPSSNKKSASASSCSLKEIIPVAFNSKKQGSTRPLTLQKSSHDADKHEIEKKNKMGDDLEDVQSVRSKQKASDGEEEYSSIYPVLADLSSSMIFEAEDYHVIDYDREYDINLKLELSLYETLLAARHNDNIQVTLKRTRARFLSRLGIEVDDDEASISLDNTPDSDVEGVLGVNL
ncbi:hypothetical protein APHAL10511_006880 [Amanita phalloides]|nr:hypothetical protein APHAL10511_006880 [Amanita phalloides]